MVKYTDHAKKLTEIADLIERFEFEIEMIQQTEKDMNWLFFTEDGRKKSECKMEERVENIRYIIERLGKYYTKKAKEI